MEEPGWGPVGPRHLGGSGWCLLCMTDADLATWALWRCHGGQDTEHGSLKCLEAGLTGMAPLVLTPWLVKSGLSPGSK